MTILDTHALIWWAAEPKKLSVRARRAIEQADVLGVCAISCWEVAMLVQKGRLELDRDVKVWLKQALALPKIELLPLTVEVAARAAAFESFHGDPADRLIIATREIERAQLVSKDEQMRSDKRVAALW